MTAVAFDRADASCKDPRTSAQTDAQVAETVRQLRATTIARQLTDEGAGEFKALALHRCWNSPLEPRFSLSDSIGANTSRLSAIYCHLASAAAHRTGIEEQAWQIVAREIALKLPKSPVCSKMS